MESYDTAHCVDVSRSATALTRVRALLAMAGDAGSRHSLASRVNGLVMSDPVKRQMLEHCEADLATLKEMGWRTLKAEAAKRLDGARNWTEVFDLLSEAKGYRILEDMGCVDIVFLARSYAQKSPDLAARLDGRTVLCEVKTIWLSAGKRKPPRGDKRAKPAPRSPEEFIAGKLTWTLQEAKAQLDAHTDKDARKIIYVVVHCDDSRDTIAEYRMRIAAFIQRVPLAGIEVMTALYPNPGNTAD